MVMEMLQMVAYRQGVEGLGKGDKVRIVGAVCWSYLTMSFVLGLLESKSRRHQGQVYMSPYRGYTVSPRYSFSFHGSRIWFGCQD